MPISQSQSVLSEIHGADPIPIKTRQNFRRLLENLFHELISEAFEEQREKEDLTQKELAGRIEKDPALISRWLSVPSNLEIDTVADLFLGMKVRLNDLTYERYEVLQERLREPIAASKRATAEVPVKTPDNENPRSATELTGTRVFSSYSSTSQALGPKAQPRPSDSPIDKYAKDAA
jgi:transcriptional regulator with XRE-family HTH domain